jgi:hypothetical protein
MSTTWNKELPTEETEARDSLDTLPNPEGGEGNVEADRRYREGVKKTLENDDVEALAEEAAEALDGPEGDELRKAEERGRHGASGATGKA